MKMISFHLVIKYNHLITNMQKNSTLQLLKKVTQLFDSRFFFFFFSLLNFHKNKNTHLNKQSQYLKKKYKNIFTAINK